MRRLFMIFILISMLSSLGFAQSDVIVDDIFKMQLFLDRKNVNHFSVFDLKKSNSLFLKFDSILTLNFDILNVQSNIDGFNNPFTFYFVDLKNVEYKNLTTDKEIQSVSLFHGLFTEYILAINHLTGQCYRLLGFNGNDIKNFIIDFNESFTEQLNKQISSKDFLKKYKVEKLDFHCLLNSQRFINPNIEKFPCLRKCSDPIQIH